MKVLITPRGYARYGTEAQKRLESLGLELDINEMIRELLYQPMYSKKKPNKPMLLLSVWIKSMQI